MNSEQVGIRKTIHSLGGNRNNFSASKKPNLKSASNDDQVLESYGNHLIESQQNELNRDHSSHSQKN
jgi:hypothetical protein